MSRLLRHLTLTTRASSLSPTSFIFPTISPSDSSSLALDKFPCEDARRSGGATQIPSPTGFEPKVIESEDLKPRKIELDRRDRSVSQERISGNNYQTPTSEDTDEFGIPTASHRRIPTVTQQKVLQTRILKMENCEKCRLHCCICEDEVILNLFENQQFMGNRNQR